MNIVDAVVNRFAAGHQGLFTRQVAVDAGATDRMVDRRLAAGRWVRVGAGVYRLAGVPVTWRQRALGACLVAGPGAVLSHRSAAVLWDVSGFRPGPLEITVPSGRSGRCSLATVHRSTQLPPGDRTTRDHIPVTRPGRLLIDLAAQVSPAALEEAVDDTLCRRLVSLDEMVLRIANLGGRRGVSTLRTVVDAWTPDSLPANVAEMRVIRTLLDAGLPKQIAQYEIWHDGCFVARVDLAYPEQRLAIELDSFRWHAGRAPFRSDRLRGNRIAAVGWRVLRATPEDAAGGHELVRAARKMLSVAA